MGLVDVVRIEGAGEGGICSDVMGKVFGDTGNKLWSNTNRSGQGFGGGKILGKDIGDIYYKGEMLQPQFILMRRLKRNELESR